MAKSNVRRRLLMSATSVALAVAGVGVTGAAASAAPANCNLGSACIWEDTNYVTNGNTGAKVGFTQYIPDFAGWNYYGTTINAAESASSVFNNGSRERASFYKNPNRGGAAFTLQVNSGDADLHNSTGGVPGGFQDTLSSGYFASF